MSGIHAGATRGIVWRMRFAGAVFIALLGVVMARAMQLQVLQADRLGAMARDQYLREIALSPRRGPVVDANDAPLAVSVDVDSVFLSPSEAQGLPVRAVAKALRIEVELVQRRLKAGGSFQWLKRRADVKDVEALEKLRADKSLAPEEKKALEAVRTVREFKRFYPQRHLAAHLLGAVGIDEQGLEGVEKAFDGELRGEVREVQALRDPRGAKLFSQPGVPAGALVGATVKLTLDSGLQQTAEEALAKAVTKAKAQAGVVVVTEPKTGAVKALATWPRFNANASATAAERRNRTVTDAWEPGSTVKCFTYAGAIADKQITPNTWVEVGEGRLPIGRKAIRDSHRPDKPVMTMTEALATSSNVAVAKVGMRMGSERLDWWLRQFGFGARTGVGLPGEAKGMLQNPAKMGDIATATTSFGQGMSATPVQLAAALGALANKGVLMKPYVVERVTSADGEVLLDRKPEVVREVVPPEVAKAVTKMMVAVTEKGGTGTLASIPGVQIAGKTGTAQKVDPLARGYSATKRFSSFMGFAPADDAAVAIYVGIDEPVGDVYGGLVAGPVFREVALEALRRRGWAPPDAGKAIEQAMARQDGATAKKAGDDLAFAEGAVDEDAALAQALVDASSGGVATRVPDLQGRSARAVRRALAAQALEVELEGSGRVVRQEPEAGSTVAPGTRVRVVLEAG